MQHDEPNLEIDMENLQQEFCRVAADLAFWSGVASRAEADLERADFALKRVEAEADELYRTSAKQREEKLTEPQLKGRVARSSAVRNAQDVYCEAVEARHRARGLALAFKTKCDALVSLGALVRAEWQGSPSIRSDK